MQLLKPAWSSAVFFGVFAFFALVASTDHVLALSWDEHSVSINASIAKIRTKETHILELIQKKKTIKEQEAMSEVLSELNKEHKELTKLWEDFVKERQHIRFEHPEEGSKAERQYRNLKLKSLHDMEAEGGLDGKLNDLKAKVKEHYGEPLSAKPTARPETKPSPEKSESEEKEKKRIKLSK